VDVVSGLAYEPIGATVAAWPAVALIFSYELLMTLVRRSAQTASEPASAPVPAPPSELNGHGHRAAELFAADLAAGTVPGIRRIREQMHVGQPRAQQIRDYLSAVTRS
jgi:hypothetical protein